MVPTMNEYFGQWKVSRFVLGDKAKGDSFNVVSRLSDIHDILTGLTVIYAGIKPAIAAGRSGAGGADEAPARRAARRSSPTCARRSGPGGGSRPRQADVLGRAAQEQRGRRSPAR